MALSLTIGKIVTVAAALKDEAGNAYSSASPSVVTWTSSDDGIATVTRVTTLRDPNGTMAKITAVSAGDATITATVGSVSGTFDVTVTDGTLDSITIALA
jgi:uncharacterized protein YjdB